MIPSGIERDEGKPYQTRRLQNGTIIVVDAYEGFYRFSKDGPRLEVRGIVLKKDAPSVGER